MKKIMFNDEFLLTKAVLDGRKTQTRRIMKVKPLFPSDEIESAGVLGDEVQIIANGGESLITMKLPFRDFNNPRQIIPQWQRDMARWAMRREIYAVCDYKDYEPRKGFKCKEYFNDRHRA